MPGSRSATAALAVCLLALPAAARLTVPRPNRFVVDQAGVIDDGVEQQMEAWLAELSQKTTANVIVLAVRSTEGEDFFSFVQRHADLWKPGTKEKDNGALIAFALKERQVRVHTGYGLERVLPDSWCGTLSRDVARQYFKSGRHTEGLRQLTLAVANRVAADANVTLRGMPRYSGRQGGGESAATGGVFACASCFMPVMILLVIVSSMARRGRHYSRWGGGGLWQGLLIGSILSGMGGGRRSSGWGGGGFGGFGGGGGGFGGGSFGGGFGGGGGGASW